jgi:hypothetical protein
MQGAGGAEERGGPRDAMQGFGVLLGDIAVAAAGDNERHAVAGAVQWRRWAVVALPPGCLLAPNASC